MEELELEQDDMNHYLSIVRAPMWLREVYERLKNGKYDNEFDFAWDMRTIFTNCMQYNAKDSELHAAAKHLLTLFDELFCEWVINPKDISLDDRATGPWQRWDYLRYFDSPPERYFCRKRTRTIQTRHLCSAQCARTNIYPRISPRRVSRPT